ncbi:hypothetical protein ABTL90_19775, partial [Acinetobacter baumannii]
MTAGIGCPDEPFAGSRADTLRRGCAWNRVLYRNAQPESNVYAKSPLPSIEIARLPTYLDHDATTP